MSSTMTLREAVEIVSWGLLPYGRICWQEEFNKRPHSAENAKRAENEAFDRFVRARAIVDAADAHWVALCRHRDNECLSDDFMLGQDVECKFKKLRALERGLESEVQP